MVYAKLIDFVAEDAFEVFVKYVFMIQLFFTLAIYFYLIAVRDPYIPNHIVEIDVIIANGEIRFDNPAAVRNPHYYINEIEDHED